MGKSITALTCYELKFPPPSADWSVDILGFQSWLQQREARLIFSEKLKCELARSGWSQEATHLVHSYKMSSKTFYTEMCLWMDLLRYVGNKDSVKQPCTGT